MASINEKEMFARVAHNIRNNINDANKLLSDCELDSKVVKEEDKILTFLSLDVNKLIKDEPKSDYYDLEKVAKVFQMMDSSKPESKKKKKIPRSESITSLSSTPSDDTSSAPEDINEIKTHLSQIQSVLGSISNSAIEVPDLNSFQCRQTSNTSNFVDLIMKLQKLVKELKSVAMSDIIDDQNTININDELVIGLNMLVKNLAEVELSRSNPITEVPKLSNASFHLSNVISAALESIEKNPL